MPPPPAKQSTPPLFFFLKSAAKQPRLPHPDQHPSALPHQCPHLPQAKFRQDEPLSCSIRNPSVPVPPPVPPQPLCVESLCAARRFGWVPLLVKARPCHSAAAAAATLASHSTQDLAGCRPSHPLQSAPPQPPQSPLQSPRTPVLRSRGKRWASPHRRLQSNH